MSKRLGQARIYNVGCDCKDIPNPVKVKVGNMVLSEEQTQ